MTTKTPLATHRDKIAYREDGRVWIAVTGPIGSGKSTLLRYMSEHDGVAASMPEDVDRWVQEGWLSDYYADPARHGLAFQMRVLASQWGQWTGAPQRGVVLSERSPMDGADVFVPLMRRRGLMSDREAALYAECASAMGWAPDLVVFVNLPDAECTRRVESRRREGEGAVDGAYLGAQHALYGKALRSWRASGIPCIEVDNAGSESDLRRTARVLIDGMTTSQK